MYFILSLVVIILQVLLSKQNNLYRCPVRTPEPIGTYGNKCYEFVIHKRESWNGARNDCRRKGGRLVTIENADVQQYLYNVLRSLNFRGDGVWIGLTDAGHEGRWTWDSGHALTYQHWASGQPGIGSAFEDCALFKMSGDNGRWHDYQCDDILFVSEDDAWVCEYIMRPATTVKPIVTHAKTTFPTTMKPTAAPTTMTTTSLPTTTSPTTPVPTTPEPTTPVPTTPAPTTPVPKTPAPTTLVPTTPASTTTNEPTTTEEAVLIG